MLPASAAETEGECALAVVSCVVQAKLCLRKFILLLFFSQWTPLHHSASRGHLEVACLLVESKADVDDHECTSKWWSPGPGAAPAGDTAAPANAFKASPRLRLTALMTASVSNR